MTDQGELDLARRRPAPSRPSAATAETVDDLPIRMLHDRVLLRQDTEQGERQTGGGLLIPATADLGKRLTWARVVAIGQHVRQVKLGDRVLFDPTDRSEVDMEGTTYLLLRERDLHAVGAGKAEPGHTGLYL